MMTFLPNIIGYTIITHFTLGTLCDAVGVTIQSVCERFGIEMISLRQNLFIQVWSVFVKPPTPLVEMTIYLMLLDKVQDVLI
jgi:hypothetical protein